MDYGKIRHDYPTAWQNFRDYSESVKSVKSDANCMVRSLYDFFDSKEIRIVITYDDTNVSWDATYYCDRQVEPDRWFPNRVLAEEHAFNRAFEILDDKLKWYTFDNI